MDWTCLYLCVGRSIILKLGKTFEVFQPSFIIWRMLALNINRKMFMMILDEESFTNIDTELCPDGLDAGVDLLLMPHQGDPELHQLVQAQPRHLVHARHTSSSKVVRVPKYFCVKCFANFFIKFFQLHIFQFLSNFSNFW